ncbi:hypothetical protein CAPTEDRAFT_217843 [Capitella teleta]|uniref:FYVE-type zinc finger domain-containing protein n=1 Tax=Capitella teleta TaxID=283909 RepID=R7VFU7_CAPTE|nr:hypothetical protein CAPTEDRAFT_217843 [Capitella teleta]|eukprot:ELU17703.1 hypothetical protein CAPTEDRAFT_217843 [Capitella teleta]
MGNEGSLPSDGSSMTPLSEAGGYPTLPVATAHSQGPVMGSQHELQQGRVTRPGSRRSSNSSSAQLSPVGPPDVDLSHLSSEERAQIAAVIARAKQVQEDEAQMVRDLEEEYSSLATTVEARRRASVSGSEQGVLSAGEEICPVCCEGSLADGTQNVCAECQTIVCADCGQYEANHTTNEFMDQVLK